jgi:hypothetical protein
LLALAVVLAVTGCSGERDTEVAATAGDFFSAVADGDGDVACELLAPSTRSELESSSGAPCADAVLEEVDAADATPEVDVYGDAARVRVGSETAFLALLDGGWRVAAAGCAAPPAADVPYDCTVSGG